MSGLEQYGVAAFVAAVAGYAIKWLVARMERLEEDLAKAREDLAVAMVEIAHLERIED